MNILSDEQQFILDNVKKEKNVIVDAVAGSGKSTTVLSIAQELKTKNILQLTYNSSLRTEIKEKIKNIDLQNIKVHTYHSLAVRYYLPTSYTDTGIRYILYNHLKPSTIIPLYDIIVIDEAQDMTFVYYKLVIKFINDLCSCNENHKIQLVILGDVMQGLYDFKGSDIRFLSLADIIWSHYPFLKTNEFIKCNMKMSYRITNQMRNFINDVMLGEKRLHSCREGEPVKYIRNSRTNLEKIVIYEINQLLNNGAKPSDIFVLGASVKGVNSNIRKMENALVSQGIPCHVPMLETADKIDERVIDKKIVFSTFHCVKGRQRKYVFIIGFDNTYLNFYARNLDKNLCPNTLYVGATRATHCLYLLESDQYVTDRPLDFLKQNHHQMKLQPYISFKGIPRTIFYSKENEIENQFIQEKHYITPTELIKFIPDSVIEEISVIIDKLFLKTNIVNNDGELLQNIIDLPSIIQTEDGFFEEVSDLNGIAIPNMYYDFLNNNDNCILYNIILDNLKEIKENQHSFLRNIIHNLPTKCNSISDYLYLSNIYVALQEKLYFKIKQINTNEYNWITENTIEKCKEILSNTIGKETEISEPVIEYNIIHNSMEEEHIKIDELLRTHFPNNELFRFTARVDLLTQKSIWEIKCISKITIDHLLQVIIYAWIWRTTRPDEKKDFKILNIKTSELMILDATIEELNFIIIALLKGRYLKDKQLDDEDFFIQTLFI